MYFKLTVIIIIPVEHEVATVDDIRVLTENTTQITRTNDASNIITCS